MGDVKLKVVHMTYDVCHLIALCEDQIKRYFSLKYPELSSIVPS